MTVIHESRQLRRTSRRVKEGICVAKAEKCIYKRNKQIEK